MRRRLPIAPAEGWATLGLVLLMCLTMAWALDDAQYVLVLAAVGGVLAAFIGAKAGWGRWLTYLVGSIFAALIVPILVGLVAFPRGAASLQVLYEATARRTAGSKLTAPAVIPAPSPNTSTDDGFSGASVARCPSMRCSRRSCG